MFVKKRAQDRLERELPSHMQSIWRYGVSLSGRKDVADDLLQATCLRALEKADQFRMGTSMIAWLLTICRSIWLNELRSAAVRKTDALEPEALDQIAAENLGQDANIFARQVFSEMMALPEAQRDCCYLVYAQGFSYREVAQMLDIPIGTVMSRLASARAKLAPMNRPDIETETGAQNG